MSVRGRMKLGTVGQGLALLMVACCMAFAGWYQATTYINPDIGWLLHVASASSNGAVVYRDILEINPPLVIWLFDPMIQVARATGGSLESVTRLAVGLLAAGSILWAAWLLTPSLRTGAIPLMAFVGLVIPGAEFGQREHLVTLLLLPYLTLILRRADERPVAPWIAFATGVATAVGLALKPHFGGIWVGLSGMLIGRLGLRQFLRLPETRAVIAAAPMYVLAITLFSPAYWSVVARFGPLYLDFVGNPFWIIFFQRPAWPAILFALAWMLGRWRVENPALPDVLGIAVVGALLGAAFQGKVFHYHFLPAISFGILLAFSLLGRWPPLTFAAGVLLLLPATFAYQQLTLEWRALNLRSGPRPHFEALLETIVEPGDDVGMLLWRVGDSWPVALPLGERYLYPMPSIWWLRALYPMPERDSPGLAFRAPEDMDTTERFLFDLTATMLVEKRPRILVVPREPGIPQTQAAPGREFDLVRYLSQDSRIADLLTRYVVEAEYDRWRILSRPH